MLCAWLVTIVAWGAILFAFGSYLAPFKTPRWARRTINVSAGTLAVLWVIGFVLYGALSELLAEDSVLWTFS